ncbi:MAG: class II aldolase/adducin family protein [Bacteroidetes bacterium]|nr:class II aldolase/adducin family protein [Bacteroidota bacterium]
MKYEQERHLVVTYLRRLLAARLTTGSGGNISVRISGTAYFAISPTGITYDVMTPKDVVVLDASGAVVAGKRIPSSEWRMHAAAYATRPDAGAVVHTHSVFATTFACLREEIPAVHYLVGFAGKRVPVAPYATYGSVELSSHAAAALAGGVNAVLLANHGLLAVGMDLNAAFGVAEEIELVARIAWQARAIGEPVVLPDDEMDVIIEKFRGYGKQETSGAASPMVVSSQEAAETPDAAEGTA